MAGRLSFVSLAMIVLGIFLMYDRERIFLFGQPLFLYGCIVFLFGLILSLFDSFWRYLTGTRIF